MNPLYRRMFQQPGVSRQPMGILASSPELANVAAQRQPLRMNQGGAVNLQTIMGELQQLQKQGDSVSLRRIASDPKFPDVVKRAASNLADSLRPDSVPLIQVGDVNLGNALSDATNRNPIGQSAGGQERSAALKAVPGKIGAAISEGFDELTRVRGPALKDVEGPLPDSPFKNMLDMFRSDASAAPQSVQSPPDFKPSTTMDSSVDSMSRIGSSMSQDTLNKIRAARGLPPVAATTDSLVGSARVTSPTEEGIFSVLAKNQAETVALMGTAAEQSDRLTDPSMLLPQTGETSAPVSPLVSDALNYENMYGTGDLNLADGLPLEVAKTPAEVLAEAKATTTPTQDAAAADAKKEAGNVGAKQSGAKKDGVKTLLTPDVINNLTVGSLDNKSKDALAATTGNAVIDQALAILQGETSATSEAEKAKGVDKTFGITGTREERTKKRKAVLQSLLGEREKDVRTDASYNLMMTGLLIAAGESPDAMTNIAKGLAGGLKGYGEAVGEEAQAITKEDRALTMMAAEEVGAEITSEKAASIKAEENRIARLHEEKMQGQRLATAIVQTQAQTSSAERIALANIASKEQLAANSFEQNLALFGLKIEQEDSIFDKKADLQKELAAIKPESDTFKLMNLFKNNAEARGEEMSDTEAYIAVKAAEATKGKATDTTLSYRRLVGAGMSTMDAWLLSQSGAVTELIKDMGADEFQKFVAAKISSAPPQSKKVVVDPSQLTAK